MKAQIAAEVEIEKEKRVAFLHQSAARRMGHACLLRGWGAWRELCEQRRRKLRLMQGVGARLMRPKLAESLATWRGKWELSERDRLKRAHQQLVAAEAEAHAAADREVVRLRHQLEVARGDVERATARAETSEEEARATRRVREEEHREADAAARELARVLDATNERRIEHLQGIAARRIGQRGLSRGWSAWRDAWEERRRQRQTLASSGARLLRPKLAASFGGWRHEWEVSQAADEVRAHEILLSRQVELRDSLELQLAAVQAELEAANKAAEEEHNAMKRRFLADALLKEEAAATQLALSLEEEREKRVNHLQRVAARRIGQQGLSRGWTAWQELYDEQVAQRQMLASAGSRLLRPKLAASFTHWRGDCEVDIRVTSKNTAALSARPDGRRSRCHRDGGQGFAVPLACS